MTVCEIELFGVPRLLAGQKFVCLELQDDAVLGDALAALCCQFPKIAGVVAHGACRSLADGYLACRDGREFLRGETAPLQARDRLLVFAAAAGGR